MVKNINGIIMMNNEKLNTIKKNIDNEGFHCVENYVLKE